ncbi:hypothetical protein W97_02662 [Coniosporium apollinis CBS 100218]|uniref:Uncharacterized protein n=1 Tax=Coniosporium apollinis (strain CBS 100218) TaxID=1168221 RepID=R7YND1_CONA1|nr:uncharacterized protein W97_02662 [Coniosporium apollinis CBS 100218]EON63435.1 hypothetical protein W97_02662 [Coniosporium apollinis CBS 100218]
MSEVASASEDILKLLQPYIDHYGLLDDSTITIGNLRNAIHPVFQRSNFDTSKDTYDTLKPALRLASQFLQNDALLEWWVQAGLGQEVSDPTTGQVYLNPPPKADDPKDNLRTTMMALAEMRYHVRFSFDPLTDVFGHTTIDRTRPSRPKKNKIFNADFKAATQIGLSDLFEWWASLYYTSDSTTECQRLRFNFFFAVNIVHELAHAFGVMRRGGGNAEPCHSRIDMLSSTGAEMGWSWEVWTFGGQIAPHDDFAAPTAMLVTAIPLPREVAARGDRKICPVPMWWIGQWFQTSTWQGIEQHGRKALPRPPRDLPIQLDDHAEWQLVKAKKRKRDSDVEVTQSISRPLKRRLWRSNTWAPETSLSPLLTY